MIKEQIIEEISSEAEFMSDPEALDFLRDLIECLEIQVVELELKIKEI